MRVLIHLSDIHFGRVDAQLIDPLIHTINEIKPHLVAVSGDLTQRARSNEFKAARAFLDSLPHPQIVVPGNHDVPLHNPFSRFLQPLEKYQRFITADLRPFYGDDEIAVVGVNTARSFTIKSGRVNRSQIEWMRHKLAEFADQVTKIVVTHHPFDLPEGHDEGDLVGRSQAAMEALASCGADLFLAGHLHVSRTSHTAKRYKIHGHSALVVQAGTAASTRFRGEANSFNVIRIAHLRIVVERLEWQPEVASFSATTTESFVHTDDGWAREEAE